MRQIAVIARDATEHRKLCEVWAFFPGHADADYHYYYPETLTVGQVSSSCRLTLHPLSGPFSSADLVPDHDTGELPLVCFASLSAWRDFCRAEEKPALTVWYARRHALCDLESFPAVPDPPSAALLDLRLPRRACLNSERVLAEAIPPTSLYSDFAEYLANSFEQVLLTRNSDLISAVCGSQTAQYAIAHFTPELVALNLTLTDAEDEFLELLARLEHASHLATRDLTPAGTLDWEAFHLPPRSSYSLFAQYYDHYMEHVNYDDWVNLMLNWYRRHSSVPLRKVLEVACGTANASEILVFRGCEVDACDSSPHMLHMASVKAFKPNLFLNSLTDPLPRRDYDLIFCLFDSINYLTQKSGIKTLLRHVEEALRPGGIFIFDISTLLNSLQNFNDTINYTRVRDGYLVQLSSYETLAGHQITQLTLFRKGPLGYERLEERHVQRVYRCPDLVEMISASGLELLAIHAPDYKANLLSRLGSDLDGRHVRLFFVLRKRG